MRNYIFLLYFLTSSFIITQCTMNKDEMTNIPSEDELELTYELVSNQIADNPRNLAKFYLTNNSPNDLPNKNWVMYFNQVTRTPIPGTVSETASIEHINGDFYRMIPTDKFTLKSGETIEISFECSEWIIKKSDAPSGIYFVFYDKDGNELSRVPIKDYTIESFTRPEQIHRFINDEKVIPTAAWQYEENEKMSLLPEVELDLIIPTPVALVKNKGKAIIGTGLMIHYQEGLKNESEYLSNALEALLGSKTMSMTSAVSGPNIVSLRTGPISVKGIKKEAYMLETSNENGVIITGNDAAGVFYGIQSLLSLLPVEVFKSEHQNIEIPEVSITDAPAFHYRGMHFDACRNFQSKATVLKFLDIMAFYKLNTFHFHITDDEGWRIDIEELPELTEIGAYRGHTLDDKEYLIPAYGSGAFPDPSISYGSGYYTRDDFKEILQYAHARHIEVIPEINMPGHARAAIKAMEYRYRRLMDEGKQEEAEAFLLSEPEDESVYSSAQFYNDNVICVGRESAYRFYETVVDDVIEMYEEAKVPLNTIHTGGDEVPPGVWEKSPLCNELLKNDPSISNHKNLQSYFFGRIVKILNKKELNIAGWEEVAMTFLDDGSWEANAEFAGKNIVPYVWNSIWGNEDLGYRLANAGYPIILCNVNNFYFDFAYNKDPEEPGAYWGGFIDTRKAFDFIPYDLYKSTRENTMGRIFNPDIDFKNSVRLEPEARANVLGIQGELWSETIKGEKMLEYASLPKMIGLSQRAWEGTPHWAAIDDKSARDKVVDIAWNTFANTLAQREFPRLNYLFGGFNYRIAPPGGLIKDGKLYANTSYPGMSLRYTTDGSEPNESSSLYEGPIEVNGNVKLRIFDTAGRGSRIIEVF